jgi:hypothetical protein
MLQTAIQWKQHLCFGSSLLVKLYFLIRSSNARTVILECNSREQVTEITVDLGANTCRRFHCVLTLLKMLLLCKLNKKFWEELIAYFPWYDTGHIENDASKNYSIVACLFVTAATFLPSRCLATIRGYTCIHTDWWEKFFNNAIEMGSGVVIYVPSFIKIGSGIQKLKGGGGIHRHTHRQQRDLIRLLFLK